jgi:hypothetical protein
VPRMLTNFGIGPLVTTARDSAAIIQLERDHAI